MDSATRAVILTTALGRFVSLILTEHVRLVTTAGANWNPLSKLLEAIYDAAVCTVPVQYLSSINSIFAVAKL